MKAKEKPAEGRAAGVVGEKAKEGAEKSERNLNVIHRQQKKTSAEEKMVKKRKKLIRHGL